MKSQPPPASISRDFVILTAGVISLLFLISSWLAYSTFSTYSERVETDLAHESLRIENALTGELESANYLLSALGHQLALDSGRDLTSMARVLRSFDSKGSLYSIFSWVSPEHKIMASSNRGVLEKPVDISDRDYIQDSAGEPWKMHIGKPIQGRVSERFVIPVAMGISDNTGKFIGTIMLSIDIAVMSEKLKNVIGDYGAGFAVVSRDFTPVLQSTAGEQSFNGNYALDSIKTTLTAAAPYGLIKHGNIINGTSRYFYYRTVEYFPYIVLLAYDLHHDDQMIGNMLWSRLLQLLAISSFFVLFLWTMRSRLLGPITHLTQGAMEITRGQEYQPEKVKGPEEIRLLSLQIAKLSDYIAEARRIEDELRNKVFILKKSKERAELSVRDKSEFLAYVCQEMRSVLNHIIGFSQAMRDQLHGPIENKKYRGYATDIYTIANTLLNYTQDLLTFSKTEAGFTVLLEKPLNVEEIIEKTLRFLQDRIHAEKRNIEIHVEENLPKLIADEFRLQQIFTSLLIYACHVMPADKQLTLEASVLYEGKDKGYFAFTIRHDEQSTMSRTELLAWADRLAGTVTMALSPMRVVDDSPKGPSELSLELFRSLVHLHQGHVGLQSGTSDIIAVFFPKSRIYKPDNIG